MSEKKQKEARKDNIYQNLSKDYEKLLAGFALKFKYMPVPTIKYYPDGMVPRMDFLKLSEKSLAEIKKEYNIMNVIVT